MSLAGTSRLIQPIEPAPARFVRQPARISMHVAADRGDHKPSKEWLLHAGVIDSIDSADGEPKVIVQIGVSAEHVKIGLRADSPRIGAVAEEGL